MKKFLYISTCIFLVSIYYYGRKKELSNFFLIGKKNTVEIIDTAGSLKTVFFLYTPDIVHGNTTGRDTISLKLSQVNKTLYFPDKYGEQSILIESYDGKIAEINMLKINTFSKYFFRIMVLTSSDSQTKLKIEEIRKDNSTTKLIYMH